MKRIVILGSTGSIGTQTLDIVRQHPTKFEVVGITANSNAQELLRQKEEFNVPHIALLDESVARPLGIPCGMPALLDLVSRDDVDLVVVSVAGVIGLVPTLRAIECRKQIALASKEVLVAAGEIVMPAARKSGVTLTPIDSEHSAIFQCIQGYTHTQIDKVIITASGGPFRGKSRQELKAVTREQALNHPTWAMGGKITIDSATLMNKGLEIIEAKWLFELDLDQIDIVVHPQSIVHSFVQFKDTSVLAQLGWPDMRIPIQYALLFPERVPNSLKPWNPVETSGLTFEPADLDVFPAPRLARESCKAGKTMPCAFNSANEEAVALFLADKVTFLQIAELVEKAMNKHDLLDVSLESLLETDRWARETVRNLASYL